jgi:Ca2+-binding RTX toxin-like protein
MRVRRTRPIVAASALLTLLAALLISASPASAATSCFIAPDDQSIIVWVDEADTGATTTIDVRSGVVYVNGSACGSSEIAINIVEAGEPKADNVVINLGPGAFRTNGSSTWVNLVIQNSPEGTKDRVRINGTSNVDAVSLLNGFVFVDQETDFPGAAVGDRRQLAMGIASSDVDLTFSLGAGNDTFQMVADDNGTHHSGWLEVRGGKGADELTGGPGRQRILGNGGADEIRGRGGNDLLRGNGGRDRIFGNGGRDTIYGGNGRDVIRAGSGRDRIISGGGADRVFGGSGADTCKCGSSDRTRSVTVI